VRDKVVEVLQAAGATEEMVAAAVGAAGEFGDSPPRPNIEIQVAALLEEAADRHDVSQGVDMTRSCIEEAPPKGLGRREMKPVPSRVRRTLRRNFVTRTGGRLIFVSNFVTPSPRALASRVIGILALPAAAAPWGIPKFPKNPSNHFLSRASSLQRRHNLVEQSQGRHWGLPTTPHGAPPSPMRSKSNR
jgi:hypothetical protein